MTISPDQLRAQRELVKRHLDWLDAQIAASSGVAPVKSPPVAVDSPAVVTSGASDETPSVAEADGAAPVPAVAVEAILETHASESGLSQGAKLGCFAIAAFVVLGFLFVLFVLPRFIYKKTAPDSAPQEQAQP
jgi:hypothetical protein